MTVTAPTSQHWTPTEGEEGKFYVWSKEELQNLPLEKLPGNVERELFYDYFSVTSAGYWEDDKYILLRKKSDSELAAKYHLEVNQVQDFIACAKEQLLQTRNQRIRPSLDNKVITSWNAMMVSGLCKAYEAFGDPAFISEAKLCMSHLMKTALNADNILLHTGSQRTKMRSGYLDDYAFTTTALLNLYQANFIVTGKQIGRAHV